MTHPVTPPELAAQFNGARLLTPARTIPLDVLVAAVRECVTIIRPGETLIIRMPVNMPDQVFAQYAQQVTAALGQGGVRAVVLRADQLAVVEAAEDPTDGDEASA